MLNVTFYSLPDGRKTVKNITNILHEDADFFIRNNLKVSMEELNSGQFVIYSTTGKQMEDSEDDEVIHIVNPGQSCEDAMHELVMLVKQGTKLQ
jgi:hypothetical protein